MEIVFKQVGFSYSKGTPFEKRALMDVNVRIKSGSYHAVIGHTGSGKSTLLQLMNGLLKPSEGQVRVGDRMMIAGKKTKNLVEMRKHIGIVFQFPEQQLFEETVEKDIMFGPMNFGVSEAEAKSRAKEYISLVGLDETFLEKSPFDLSGGQMRRVAIAGVLAMKPSVLILDEPTAGLDPRGRNDMMELFAALHLREELTTILVTHSMEDAWRYADEVTIMYRGKSVLTGETTDVLTNETALANYSLRMPHVMEFKRILEQRLGVSLEGYPKTEQELAKVIASRFAKEGEE
ncbi:energy-coupling factor ABC transporter ATP-binding protein [Paenisporosarcina cavernae]|uniref:Energy-coupling factor transporter ATP-binding protein EcfA2 n=1 Tax=Paenisporosarcina cavernae TaxID=2320858 RepID=A0A385YVL7_9BACL|nr:energy-coupling factor ABC transporter ATP-binding protein [Paenisporosarcina cavernae]AYC30584.1 energy-coupling factor ABC transporter ATP-binding protein [Paenisporosarcina cavernae]